MVQMSPIMPSANSGSLAAPPSPATMMSMLRAGLAPSQATNPANLMSHGYQLAEKWWGVGLMSPPNHGIRSGQPENCNKSQSKSGSSPSSEGASSVEGSRSLLSSPTRGFGASPHHPSVHPLAHAAVAAAGMTPPFAMMMSNLLSPGSSGGHSFGSPRPPTPTPTSPHKGNNTSPGRNSRPLSSPAKLARIVTTQGQLICNCGGLFPNIDILERHMLAEHPENTNLPCTVCKKQFPSMSKLQRHVANHVDSPELRKFKCNFDRCGKAFKFKHHLKEHERIHTGEKPFLCKHCGKKFSHSGSFSSHTTSKKCLQIGRRPGLNNSLLAAAAAGGHESVWQQHHQQQQQQQAQQLRSKKIEDILSQHHQQQIQQQQQTMPLSPPLTPLPPRFAPPHQFLPHAPSPFAQMFLAAQAQHYNQLLAAKGGLAAGGAVGQLPQPFQAPAPMEVLENIQKLIKLRQAEMAGSLSNQLKSDSQNEHIDVVNPVSPPPPPSQPATSEDDDTNIWKPRLIVTSREEELKREEALLEDEMKEEEEDDDEELDLMEEEGPVTPRPLPSGAQVDQPQPAPSALSFGIAETLKKHFESNDKFSVIKSMMDNQQDIPCKNGCGQSFKNIVEFLRHGDSCQMSAATASAILGGDGHDDSKSNQSFEESYMSDHSHNNSSSFNNNKNACDPNNSSSDERKVRVRTLISDEQLAILKAHYLQHPRPKREELEKIANQIGHPFKVVKVWFQNSRARDRREGKPSSSAMSPAHPDLSGVPSAMSALAAHMPFFTGSNNGSGAAVSGLPATAAGPNPFSFLNNNFPPMNTLLAAGLLPRMPGLMNELFNNNKNPLASLGLTSVGLGSSHDRSSPSPRSDSKSPCSMSASDDGDTQHHNGGLAGNNAVGKATSDQPLDLSNKGSSPSVSPLSRGDECNVTPLRHDASPLMHWAQQQQQHGMRFGSATLTSSSHDLFKFHDENDEDGSFVCDKDKCDKIFTKKSSLARHKFEHSDERPWPCNWCSKKFKHKHHLTEHQRLHTGEKPFRCPKCLKRFSHSGSYSQHINHRFANCKPPTSSTDSPRLENPEEGEVVNATGPEMNKMSLSPKSDSLDNVNDDGSSIAAEEESEATSGNMTSSNPVAVN